MSIKYCSECGKEVIKNAKVCPHCGHKLLKSSFMGTLFKIIMWMLIIFIVIGILGSFIKESEEKYKQTIAPASVTKEQCETMYSGINKDMDKFIQLDIVTQSDDMAMIAVSNVMSDNENVKKIVENINTVKRNIIFYQGNCQDITRPIDTTEFYKRFPN